MNRRETLEFQADQIEAVLAQHEISVRVTGGLVFPRWIQFQMLPSLGERVGKIKDLSEEGEQAQDEERVFVVASPLDGAAGPSGECGPFYSTGVPHEDAVDNYVIRGN